MLRRGDVSKKFCQAARDSESVPDPVSFRAGDRCHWRENPPDERYSGTTSLAPAFMRGEGREAAGGVPRAAGKPSQSRCARQLSQGESQGGCAPFLPPAFMRGEGHAVARGVPPPQRGKPPQSRLRRASSPRGEAEGASHRSCPPAFMRGEGHAVAGGVPRRSGDGPLSHGFAVPALPEGKPRGLRAVLAPRIYEGGGPRSGRGSPPRRGKPPQSRLRRASSPRGEAEGASPRSCPPHL